MKLGAIGTTEHSMWEHRHTSLSHTQTSVMMGQPMIEEQRITVCKPSLNHIITA